MRDNAITKRAYQLTQVLKLILFENKTSDMAKFLCALQIAQYLAESVLRKNEMAMSSIATAKKLVMSGSNSSDRMSVMAASELQGQSIIEDRLALSVINFAINKSSQDTDVKVDNFLAKMEMGIELLIGCQPEIAWESKLTNQVKKIVRNH